jgi:hypothetical protein
VENGNCDDDQLHAALLAYMREHPAAADTLDAIPEWWGMRRIVHVEVNAFAPLTAAGLVHVIESGDRRAYRLGANRPS